MRPTFLGLLCVACATQGLSLQAERAELVAMFNSDQAHRTTLQMPGVEEIRQQIAIDQANLKRLDAIVASNGWPTLSQVGERAATGAFLVVQHADLATQERYLPLMRQAASAGEARLGLLALLEDRVLTDTGKMQRYGSQFESDGKGGWKLCPIEDEAHVDERRKAMGLEPLAEYVKTFTATYAR